MSVVINKGASCSIPRARLLPLLHRRAKADRRGSLSGSHPWLKGSVTETSQKDKHHSGMCFEQSIEYSAGRIDELRRHESEAVIGAAATSREKRVQCGRQVMEPKTRN